MIECAALVGAVAIILVAIFRDYKVKMDRKSVVLEKNDKKGEKDHKKNEERIIAIEKKNGSEQHQIDELKKKISELEKQCEKKSQKYDRN